VRFLIDERLEFLVVLLVSVDSVLPQPEVTAVFETNAGAKRCR